MNNVYYLEVAKLMLPEDVYNTRDFSGFKIMYRRAIKYGETVRCLYGETESAYVVTVKGEEDDVRAIIELKK
jgi:acyl-ACP thioesterase